MRSANEPSDEAAEREVPTEAPQLPGGLAARLAGFRWHRNLVGEAGAHVYRLQREGGRDFYLKHGTGDASQDLMAEAARLRWMSTLAEAASFPLPVVEHFECTGDEAWLLTPAMPGRTAHEWLAQAPGRQIAIVRTLADTLRRWHQLPAAPCPFNADHPLRLALARQRLEAGLVDADDFDDARSGWTAEDVWREMTGLLPLEAERVVTHGDFSLDNLLLDEHGQVTGVIDVGRLGIADPYQDLAILANCLEEFGADLQRELFTAYGIPSPDERRLNFHLCLDECF